MLGATTACGTMYRHKLQSNRFELKYLVSEGAARAAREFCSSYLTPDEYARPELGNAYQIHSLYLDSPGMDLCRASMTGLKNRFKLRIRFYDEVPHHPVFFEIKSRLSDVVKKERAAVRRDRVLSILNYRWPDTSDLFEYDSESMASVENFCRLRDVLHADGCLFVSYLREAYVSPRDDQIRVTFDRKIQSGMYGNSLGVQPFEARYQPQFPGVVLELKFCDRFPLWMRDLVQELNLQRVPLAKYVFCVESLNNYAPLATSDRLIAARTVAAFQGNGKAPKRSSRGRLEPTGRP